MLSSHGESPGRGLSREIPLNCGISAHPNPSNGGLTDLQPPVSVGHVVGTGEGLALRRREEIVSVCAREHDAERLFKQVAGRLRSVVPFDASTWMSTDPATMLPTQPTFIENIDASHCAPFWHREFFVDDTNLFVDLARRGITAATLVEATAHRPRSSSRFRELLVPHGYGDELRMLLRVSQSTWGVVQLFRDKKRPAFSPGETALVASISQPLGAALRRHVLSRPASPPGHPDGPGLLCFDRRLALMSVNDDARRWLEEISERPDAPEWLPSPVQSVLAKAAVAGEGRPARSRVRARVKTRSGQWALVHASTMSDGNITVIIEPAQAAEIAPIIVEAYDLSAREQQVTELVARGFNTNQIAAELVLSAHTVRDYVKTVFEKVGVTSRGELVAKLFAEHYESGLH